MAERPRRVEHYLDARSEPRGGRWNARPVRLQHVENVLSGDLVDRQRADRSAVGVRERADPVPHVDLALPVRPVAGNVLVGQLAEGRDAVGAAGMLLGEHVDAVVDDLPAQLGVLGTSLEYRPQCPPWHTTAIGGTLWQSATWPVR
jgi:hypothetical protein